MTRRATALPTVLFVLALTSALAVGGAYVTRGAAAAGRLMQRGAESGYPVERALVELVAEWDSSAMAALGIGVTTSMTATAAGNTLIDRWITRLTASTYGLVAESSDPVQPRLRRRIGLLVSIRTGRPEAVRQRPWSQLP